MTEAKRKPRRKPKSKPLGTIWEIPGALWGFLPTPREFRPKKPTRRRTANIRARGARAPWTSVQSPNIGWTCHRSLHMY